MNEHFRGLKGVEDYKIKQLLEYFQVQICDLSIDDLDSFANKEIEHLRLDSRSVKKKDLFIALKGKNSDGRNFISQAIEAGAIAIIAETENMPKNGTVSYHVSYNNKIPQINVYKLADKLSEFASMFYGRPSEKMKVVGVTGTNGKTTVTQLIAQWAELTGGKAAVLGTIGNGVLGDLEPAINTTSSSVDIQRYFSDFLTKKVNLVVMEVSSHGLALDRVKDVAFSASVFTNLSRDHLDFHKTMARYERAKWSLFSSLPSELAVKCSGKKIINYDDAVGKKWMTKLDDDLVVVSTNSKCLKAISQLGKPYICIKDVVYHEQGASIHFDSSFGSGELESHLFGSFNVTNLFLAFATLLALDFPFFVLINTAHHLQPVIGRMEVFSVKSKPTVIVDYAHTPDALDKALSAIKDHCLGNLWVIFGCGGDRDKGKRPLMAKIASLHTNNIIITNDNPRTEDQDMIINDIREGFSNANAIRVIKNRKKAIQWAISHAGENDIILVAGKGHEDYQIIGGKRHVYSDRTTVSDLLEITL